MELMFISHVTEALGRTLTVDRIALLVVVTIISWLVVIVATLVDMWDGLYTARKLGEKLRSHKFRHTIQKLGEYWRVMLIGLVFDTLCLCIPWYNFTYLTILAAVGLLIIEVSSMVEHIKRRKNRLSELPEIIAGIISCVDEKDAMALVKKIKESVDTKNG